MEQPHFEKPLQRCTSIACSPPMVCWSMAPFILLSMRDSSKTLPRLFTGSSDTMGIRLFVFVYLADILSAFCIPMGCEGTLIDLPFI